METHCHIALSSSVALTSGSGDYELDTDVLALHKVIDSVGTPLVRVDEEDIYQLRRGTASASTTSRYALSGANVFMVYPTPTSAATLSIYYVPRPTPMSSASHDPSSSTYGKIPAEWHKGIELYALWQGADYDDDASSNQGDRYFSQYTAWLGKINTGTRLKGGRKLPRARVGRQVPIPRVPSEDQRWA